MIIIIIIIIIVIIIIIIIIIKQFIKLVARKLKLCQLAETPYRMLPFSHV